MLYNKCLIPCYIIYNLNLWLYKCALLQSLNHFFKCLCLLSYVMFTWRVFHVITCLHCDICCYILVSVYYTARYGRVSRTENMWGSWHYEWFHQRMQQYTISTYLRMPASHCHYISLTLMCTFDSASRKVAAWQTFDLSRFLFWTSAGHEPEKSYFAWLCIRNRLKKNSASVTD